ncbi:M23 family metallopeptidase [Mucilaginibacter ginsenosidivorans]|uniref:Peptidoglycan DD-metalloendopeptidase family protein n=1 Tax=Mucilaginibacter ginsenosidivorans TaxID=398053 RepID=A0A5B8UUR7_9SPHI|nr:M23 family metallopeptidase [Mucilaginibacter ginsenosidivorans]QEC62662.1 peptidoglycan DD-metalloendopeptidase family protein [Mucilaginibacter ginsenosidivorans]
MNLKLTNFSTIIIVNKNQEQTQAIRVKTKHLKRVKHYIATIGCVILALACMVIYLSSKGSKDELEKQQLRSQIARLQSKLPAVEAAADSQAVAKSSAQTYIESIQGKLQKINDYLRKRGLKGFSTKDIGGDNKAAADLSDNEKYSLYDEYLSRLLNSVAFTPMGYPRISSITSAFGYRSDPFDGESAELHPGIDFRGAKGDPVHVTADGKVVFTGWKGGYGNCIIVQHKNDFQTLYGHLSHINVQEGEPVKTGDVIGKVGSTGRSTGTHLHYEVRKNGKPVNPVRFLTLNN